MRRGGIRDTCYEGGMWKMKRRRWQPGERVKDLIARMTLEEKIHQMCCVSGDEILRSGGFHQEMSPTAGSMNRTPTFPLTLPLSPTGRGQVPWKK